MTIPPPTDATDVARQAFEFATRNPSHPLSEILRSKAAALMRSPSAPLDLLEVAVVLRRACEDAGELHSGPLEKG